MTKVKNIIIGANGYIGKNLAWYLHQKGEDTICYDLAPIESESWMTYKPLDITNKEQLKSVNFNCENVFMFAGLTGTSQGFDQFELYNDINVNGLANILNQMKENNSKARLVFPSTRLVYKGQTKTYLVENDPKESKTVYALNKLTCESLLEMYADIFNINYSIFRICVPYGHILPNSYSYGTIGFFISKAEKGEDITLFGDGELRRTFTHVSDICSSICSAIEKEESNRNIYNIGGENLSLKEAAEIVSEKYKNIGLAHVNWPELALKIESGDTIFNDEKLVTLLGEYKTYCLKNTIL